MDEELVMLSGRVPKDLKSLVDADPRPNQEVLQVALRNEMGGERQTVIENRIQEKENRVSLLESEIDSREEEIEQEVAEIEALERKQERLENEDSKLMQDVKEKLANVTLQPDNPGVQAQAKRVDMTPEELIEVIRDDE